MVDLSKYDEIIIWGASFSPDELDGDATSHGFAMEKLAGLLKKEEAWGKVIAVVDSNKALHGKERLGIVVREPKYILEHEKALVIINSISICSINRAMDSLGAKNDRAVIPFYFYHGTLEHPYDNKLAQDDTIKYGQSILKLYDINDAETRRYLDIILLMRKYGRDDLYDISYYEGTGEHMAYFCDSELAPDGDVTYIDVGAYDGDSLVPVEKFYGERLKRYYGFEPNGNSMEKLRGHVEKSGLTKKAVLLPFALGENNKTARFSANGLTSKESERGEIILDQKRFDDLSEIEIVGEAMVKMDIEGAELNALKGMKGFIKKHTPYMAICIYHKEHDLYEIANYIKHINDEYRLYIRGGWHLECWAVPQRHYE